MKTLRTRGQGSSGGATPVGERVVMGRAFAFLYGSGGALVLLSLALPHPKTSFLPGVLWPAVIALCASGLLLVAHRRLPIRGFCALPLLGTVLISTAAYSGGASVITVYATFYFWVILATFYFFSRRWGLVNLAFIGVAYALVLGLREGVTSTQMRWVIVVGTVGVAGLLVGSLRERVDRLIAHLRRTSAQHELVAELGERALEGAEMTDLMEGVAAAIGETLDVELSSVWQLTPDGDGLLLRAGRGWEDELMRKATVATGTRSMGGFTLECGHPVVSKDIEKDDRFEVPELISGLRVRSGMCVAVRRPGGFFGVLGAHSTRARSFGRDDVNFLQSLAHLLSDSISRSSAEAEIRHQALHEPLTDLPNRTLFTDRLKQALSRSDRTGSILAVFMIDVDNFKMINDSLGHQAGDELLTALGPRLREDLFVADTVSRFGGDEFAVICEDLSAERAAIDLAKRMLASLERPFELRGEEHRVTASIGVVVAGDTHGELTAARRGVEWAEELIRDADVAMYRAKELGRNRFELFDEELRLRTVRRLTVERELYGAIDRGELVLHYQPIVSLESEKPVAFEALVRWQHPERGLIPPGEFLPVAEQSGLIVPIGRWVLEEACRQLLRWDESDPDHRLGVSVNLAARQVADPDLLDDVAAVLDETGIEPSRLGLELTESTLIEDARAPVDTLRSLRRLGVRLSLDDFGTGYSSLSYLQRFPIDTLKVDRAFVARMGETAEDYQIVRAITTLAQTLGLGVVAEGVETNEQLAGLRRLGCDLAQGFLFARPLPADQALRAIDDSELHAKTGS